MYDELFDAWREEKHNPELQKLPSNFYDRLAKYIKKIREEKRMLDKKTIRGKLLQQEEENVKRLTKELVQTRYKKISNSVYGGGSPPSSSMTQQEVNLFKKILTPIKILFKIIAQLRI